MRTFLILLSAILLSWGTASAQHYFPELRDPGAKYPIDTCRLWVTYDFAYVEDTLDMKILHDRTLLEIGPSTSRYYSQYTDRIDSMAYLHYLEIPRTDIARLEKGIQVWNWLQPDEHPWYCDVYTFPKEKKRMVSTRFLKEEYRYDEPVEALDWRITEQTDTVAGYLCRKAVATFRGRTWEAWFAPEIPQAHGPWKLGGLPGLILKAADTEGLFRWTAIGLEQPVGRMIHDYADKALNGTNRSEPIIPSHRKVKCSRKDVDRLWRRQWLAPLTVMFLDGEEHIIYDMSTQKTVEIDINYIPEGYYPKLELDI